MTQRWEQVSFLHWPTDPAAVQRLTHPDLIPDTHGGMAWVGLVPFRMVGIGPSSGPSIPFFGTFPETNVRTYVIGPHGPGVWFHSLDASRLLPVAFARLGYRLPYFYSAMHTRVDGGVVTYHTTRRWPGPRGAGGMMSLAPGAVTMGSELDHFLTARWRLYTSRRGRLYCAEVRHPEWPLRSARVVHRADDLVDQAGYRVGGVGPIALYSEGVPVDVYRPRRVG